MANESSESFEKQRQLLELSRDIDRNLSDHEFDEAGGTIHYVFDENIFEYLIGGIDISKIESEDIVTSHEDKRKFSAVFHAEVWRPQRFQQSDEKFWMDVNRQASIVASEYLFSTNLPAQRSKAIYVTQWHWDEMLRRMKILARHFTFLAKNYSVEQREFIHQSITRIKDIDKKHFSVKDIKTLATKLRVDCDYFEEDAQSLIKAGIKNENVTAYMFNMVVSAFLTGGRHDVAVRMITDLFKNGGIGGTLKPAYLIGRYQNSAEIRSQAKSFVNAIDREQELQNRPNKRRRASILNDAYSLAYIYLLNKSLPNDEKVVFVTGDDLIFDAYRRIWSEDPQDDFMLRRPVQFTPLLNTLDMQVGLSSDEIFEKVRVAIEPALMFFNLGQQISADGGNTTTLPNIKLNVGREFLALFLKTHRSIDSSTVLDFFGRKQDDRNGEMDAKSVHEEIGVRFREYERLTIGGASKYIMARFERVFDAEMLSALLDSEGYAAYLERGLGNVFELNAKFHVPRAFEAVTKWLRKTSLYDERVPIASLLRVPSVKLSNTTKSESDAVQQQTIIAFVDTYFGKLRQHGDGNVPAPVPPFPDQWLVGKPISLFAAASMIALRIGMWEEASEYAEISLKAIMREFSIDPSSARLDYVEVLYLYCLAKRFDVIHSKTDLQDFDAIYDEVRKQTSTAIQLLDIEEAQAGKSQDRWRFGLLHARARSEKIAMAAFYAAQFLLENTHDRDKANLSYFDRVIASVQKDIDECLGFFECFEDSVKSLPEQEVSAFETVRRQIAANVSSLYCMAWTLKRPHHDTLSNFEAVQQNALNFLDKLIDQRLSNDILSKLPHIVFNEIHLYQFLRKSGDQERQEMIDNLEILINSEVMTFDKSLAEIYLECLRRT